MTLFCALSSRIGNIICVKKEIVTGSKALASESFLQIEIISHLDKLFFLLL